MSKQVETCIDKNSESALILLAKLAQSDVYNDLTLDAFEAIDTKNLCNLAVTHGLNIVILENIKEVNKATECTPEITTIFNTLNNIYAPTKIFTYIVNSEAKKLIKALTNRNIQTIALKGFALGHQVYQSPELRPKTDIDILINTPDKKNIIETFNALGYVNPRGWEPQAIINQFSMSKPLSKGVNVLFDIHLKISNSKPIEDILNYQELLEDADKTTLEDINLISKPYAIIHAIFHLLHHKASGDLVKLIWYYDIFLLIEKATDEELAKLKRLTTNKGLAAIVLNVLVFTREYFPAEKINQLILWCEQPEIINTQNKGFNYLLGDTYGAKGLLITLKTTKGIKQKWAVLQETLFPPKEEIEKKYGKNNTSPLILLYLKRIFFGVIKYLTPKNNIK